MAAGDSAAFEAERQRLLALELAQLQSTAAEMARRFSAAASSERRLAHTLEALESRGYQVLADRRWPKSRRAQVDFIVVGPGGIFIVDAKAWKDVTIAAGCVFRGQEDVTDEFNGIADLAENTRATLADLGLAPGEVHALAVFTNQRTLKPVDLYGVTLVSEADSVTRISRAGQRLDSTRVTAIVVALEELFPIYRDSGPLEFDLSVPEPVLPADPAAITLTPTAAPALLTAAEIESALVEGVLAQPIEEWMAFLHPTQAHLVRRSFSGPSRIRGAAGTGKTVVGLHRAAYLARAAEGKVLVTTFVRTLPAVLSALLERLAPEVTDRVEFIGVYGFATNLLKDRGIRYNLNPQQIKILFDRVWLERGSTGLLGRIDPSSAYWKEEIDSVIKGRGLTRFDDYAKLARSGRRRKLSVDQRTAVWNFYVEFETARKAAGIHDFPDIISRAEASLRERPLEGYSAVIIDEAQDLSCMMVRMLHSLVADKADGLNLIGDGQQTIYPGGFTLAEANVSIAGRGVVMTTNYRNTKEIVEFAATLVAGDEFVDIEGGSGTADATGEILRSGARPTIQRFTSNRDHDASLVKHIRSVASGQVALGDIGVLAMHKWHVTDVVKALTSAGIPSVDLENYDGRPTHAVKVGTVHRAKGLEFKQVFVARTSRALLDNDVKSIGDARRERHDLDRRALYVAMTRARDGLWVGVA